jgi:hypothetical protein
MKINFARSTGRTRHPARLDTGLDKTFLQAEKKKTIKSKLLKLRTESTWTIL